MKDAVEELFEHETEDEIPAEHARRIHAGLASLLGDSIGPLDHEDVRRGPASDGSLARPSPTPRGGTGWLSPRALKVLAVSAVGVGMGAGGFVLGRSTAPSARGPEGAVVVSPLPPSVRTSEPTLPAPTTSEAAPDDRPAPPPASTPSPSEAHPPKIARPDPSSSSAFDRERSLLERARSALVRHDAVAAQEALDTYAREFPRSRHAEERDYLTIQLLRERGDEAKARERAKAFLAAYPDSLLRARLEPLIE